MSLLVAETVVESTTYDALTNAIEAVVKTHTLIESKKLRVKFRSFQHYNNNNNRYEKYVTTEKET